MGMGGNDDKIDVNGLGQGFSIGNLDLLQRHSRRRGDLSVTG